MTGSQQQPTGGSAEHLGDDVIDLALGLLSGERRAGMAAHLLTCVDCRADYDELRAAIDDVVLTAPAVSPPIGFDERTLARMGGATAAAGPAERGRRPRPRWVPLSAAAAVLIVALAVGGWLAVRSPSSVGDAQVATLTAVDGGRAVGSATRSQVGDEAVLVVGLTTAEEGSSLTCRMRFADGSTLDTPPWDATSGAAWLVALPEDRGELEDIELVGLDTGAVWSTAEF